MRVRARCRGKIVDVPKMRDGSSGRSEAPTNLSSKNSQQPRFAHELMSNVCR
jgi:hypothetical protein